MKEYAICIPTYKRKNPLCLKLLEQDKSIELNLFVRQELLDEKYYDDLAKIERVNIIDLGKGLHELGETRSKIMKWCRSHSIRYCVMLDDGVYKLYNKRIKGERQIHDCIMSMINRLKSENAYFVGASFGKAEAMYCDNTTIDISSNIKQRYVLANVPTQAVLLDTNRCLLHHLRYKSLDEVGFEDCAFFIDALKKKCLYASDPSWQFAAIIPNAVKEGGSHENNTDLERKYDIQMKRCKEYIGNIYGVTMEKRYRRYAQSMLTMIEIDCDYFLEVLVYAPEENAKIIADKFEIK